MVVMIGNRKLVHGEIPKPAEIAGGLRLLVGVDSAPLGAVEARGISKARIMPDYEKIAASISTAESASELNEAYFEAQAQKDFFPLDHPKYQGLAEAKGYDQSYARLQRAHYSHEAMIDVILANPNIKQNELAQTFEKSVPWISRILGSDAFQAALAKRRDELTDPFLVATIEERFRGLAFQSLDIITEKLEATKNVDLALKSLDISAKSLGFGARSGGGTQQNQFIIQLPPKAANSSDWVGEHKPMKTIGGSNG